MKKLMASTALALMLIATSTVCLATKDKADSAKSEAKASKDINPNAVIAKVDDKKITMLDLAQLFQSLPPQLQQVPLEKAFPALRAQLVDMLVMVAEAKEKGLEADKDVKKAIDLALEKIKEQVLVQTYVEKNVKISDKDIRAKYEERKEATKDEYEVKASHVLVKTEEEAKDIIKALKDGAKFEKIAREKSLDKGSAQNGGDLGYFGKNDMVPEFTKVAFELKNGKFSEEPVQSKFGYHVIWKKDQRKMKAPSIEEVRELLKAKLMQDQIQKLTQELRKKHKIELYDMDGKKVTQ